jgi:hypothetical protein
MQTKIYIGKEKSWDQDLGKRKASLVEGKNGNLY